MENVSAPVHALLPRRQREGRSLGSQDFPRRSSAGEGGQNWFASHPSPAWPGACALAFPFSSDFPYRMHEASRVWSCALLFLRHEVVCDFCLELTHTYTRRCGSASSGIQVFHAQFHAPGMCYAAPCFAANGVTTAVLESRQELRMRVASAHDPESNQSRRDQLEGFLLQSFRPGER